jgi:hypothetical protein
MVGTAQSVPLSIPCLLQASQIVDTFPCHGRSGANAALAVLIHQVQSCTRRSVRGLGIIMKTLLAVAIAASMIAAAGAQPMTGPGPEMAPSAFGADPIIQITTTFRARVEGSADPRDVPSSTAQDTTRRTLYNMAANECTLLAEFWKADCRLNSFYVSVESVIGPEGRAQLPSMIGTAVYELRPFVQAR